MPSRVRAALFVSAGLLLMWSPVSARHPQPKKQGLLRSVVSFVRNPAQALRQMERDNMAKQIRQWRASGLKVVKSGGGYMTFAKPRPPVTVPGNDYAGWLKALGPEGARQQYHRGNMVRPKDVENSSWKLKAVIRSPHGFVKYDLPDSISLGYDPSNARRYDGKKTVQYHADLHFVGKRNARARVVTNLSLRDLAGDLKQQKKSRYFDLEFDLPTSKVHSTFPYFGKEVPFRVSFAAKMLSPSIMIASTGHVSGNQRTDQIAIYERKPAR